MITNRLLSIPQFDETEIKQVEKYLRIIIHMSLALNSIYCLIIFYSLDNPIKPLIANGGLFFVHIFSLFLLYRKQVKNAVIFNLAGAWVCLSLMPFFWEGDLTPAILGFFIIILLAGLLLTSRWAYFFTFLSIFYAVFILIIDATSQLTKSAVEGTPLYTWGGFVIAILALVIIYELSTEKLNHALDTSRRNIVALNEKNKLLLKTQRALQENVFELSRAESALRLSQKHLRTVVESAPVILWTSDTEGRMTLLEGKTLSDIQIKANQFHGETIFDALGERVKNLDSKIKSVLEGETIVSIEKLRGRIFEIHFSPLYEQEAVSGIIGVAIDITERAQAQDAMIYLQKTESLGVLAGGIAHDFNNLLVGILGQASVGLYKMEASHPSRKHIEKAILAAEKAGGLTSQLLAYSGRGQFKIHSLDLNELVRENINLFQTALSRNVGFQISLHNTPLIVDGDMAQLQQVIMNLIINGAEAIGQNAGEITVKTSLNIIKDNNNQKDWAGNSLPVGTYAKLEISDTGRGMISSILKKIFDPFFTTKNTGQGLGLAAVQGIIRGHNGSLYVSSEVNVGTTFQVLLPLSAEDMVQTKTSELHPTNLSDQISTVLQVDDDQSVCEALKDILSTQNISVLSGLTRQQGVEIFQQNHKDIDLIILDMTMPGLGLEKVVGQLKDIDSETPIILSSGFDKDEVAGQIDPELIQGFISKPYSVDFFVSQIIELLDIDPAGNENSEHDASQ
ncbi:MAG: ATP-binding protein [Anaerolineae bacterium]